MQAREARIYPASPRRAQARPSGQRAASTAWSFGRATARRMATSRWRTYSQVPHLRAVQFHQHQRDPDMLRVRRPTGCRRSTPAAAVVWALSKDSLQSGSRKVARAPQDVFGARVWTPLHRLPWRGLVAGVRCADAKCWTKNTARRRVTLFIPFSGATGAAQRSRVFLSHSSKGIKRPPHGCSRAAWPLASPTRWGTPRNSQPGTASPAARLRETHKATKNRSENANTSQPRGVDQALLYTTRPATTRASANGNTVT